MTSHAETHRAVGLSSLPERLLLLLAAPSKIAIEALSQFVTAKASLTVPARSGARGDTSVLHTFAVCVLHPHTFEPRVVSEFTSDATAVLATLEQVLTEYGHQNANLANGACAPAALDLSRLLMYVKPMLNPSPHMSSLLRVVCVYRGNENSSSSSSSASAPIAPFFSAGVPAHVDVLGHPGFVFDLLYLHNSDTTTKSDEQHQAVFNAFGPLKMSGDGFFYHKCPCYFFARCIQDLDGIHVAVAMMLQHPALRQPQPEDFCEMEKLLLF